MARLFVRAAGHAFERARMTSRGPGVAFEDAAATGRRSQELAGDSSGSLMGSVRLGVAHAAGGSPTTAGEPQVRQRR